MTPIRKYRRLVPQPGDIHRDIYAATGRLSRLIDDRELLSAVLVSENRDCQWLAAWLDDVALPALADIGNPVPLILPIKASEFVPLVDRAIEAATDDMRRIVAAGWKPPPRQPLLPGDWPEQTPPPRTRWNDEWDAERLDVLMAGDLARREPGQEPPEFEPHEPEFDIDEFEEWDGALPGDDEAPS